MPKLHGVVEYRFVKPYINAEGRSAWRHPDGYKFTVISDQLSEDAYAERIDSGVRKFELAAQIDGEIGHDHELGCRVKVDPVTGVHSAAPDAEWRCQRSLRLVRESARTAERTMLVRIEIP